MQAFLQRTNWFLAGPIGLPARLMLLAAAVLLAATYFFPLWNLTMFAAALLLWLVAPIAAALRVVSRADV